jgi:hypothetical protein
MPRIEIYDLQHGVHTIHSTDRDLIARWLAETIGRLGPGAAAAHRPLRIQFWPMYDASGNPDWLTDSRFLTSRYDLNVAGLQQLLDDLRAAGVDVPETTGAAA